MCRLLIWSGVGAWRAEAATADLGPGGLSARGTQLGREPLPYRLDYGLEVDKDWITRELRLEARGTDWTRRLDLRHGDDGRWSRDVADEGDVPLPAAGGDHGAVAGALDCDLAFCPLTNVMPIRRHELHLHPGERDFLMAWVSVPDLGLHPLPPALRARRPARRPPRRPLRRRAPQLRRRARTRRRRVRAAISGSGPPGGIGPGDEGRGPKFSLKERPRRARHHAAAQSDGPARPAF